MGTDEVVSFGDTLNDLFRGPDGAVGGGVCLRNIAGGACGALISERGDANGGRGDTDACGICAGDILDALGPVGAVISTRRSS